MGFADDTAVRDEGGGRYRTEIRPGWDIAGNANGGYLLSIVTRAMRDVSGRPDPVSVTGHYLAPGHPGPAEVLTEVVKQRPVYALQMFPDDVLKSTGLVPEPVGTIKIPWGKRYAEFERPLLKLVPRDQAP